MEIIRNKLYDLEISIERLKGLQETLEELLIENDDIRVNAIIKSLEREIEEASNITTDIEHETMNKK